MANNLAKIGCARNGNGATWTLMMCIGVWLLVFALQTQTSECRYLPTRSHGDDLDKLRELMLQILESSNEDQQRPANEASGSSGGGNAQLSHRSAWLNKLGGPADNLELQRKYAARGMYDSGRFY